MKTNNLKRGLSLLLAMAMCLSLFLGIAPTTVSAAGDKSDVYLIAYPREGDNNADGDWGHGELHYMNGWDANAATTTIVRAMGSYSGTVCYCIEPGVHQNTGDVYTSRGEDYWDNYPDKLNATINGATIKTLIGRILQYGYTGKISLDWRSHKASDADKIAHLIATQILIWETVVGERDASFKHITVPSGCDAVKKAVAKNHPLREKIFDYYDSIVASVQNHTTVPSFCGQTVELEWNGKAYEAVLTDKNGVLAEFSFSAGNDNVQISASGSKLTITSSEALAKAVTITASKNNSTRKGVITWTDGNYGYSSGIQDVVSYTQSVSDPVSGSFKIKVGNGGLKIMKTAEDGNVAGITFSLTGNGLEQTVTTNADGEILLDDLKPGTYTVTEVGYNVDVYEIQESKQVTVIGGETAEVSFNNTLKRGQLRVIKEAEDGLVDGVTFRLHGSALNGHTVDEYAVTDSEGVAVFENVPLGSGYVLEEVETPDRYVIPEPQTAPIEWNTVTEKHFTNVLKKWTATVTKMDAATDTAQGDAVLSGAVYGVYKGDELMDTYTTDENGQFITREYPCGDDWTIREITPSEGYTLDATTYPVGAEPEHYTLEQNSIALTVLEQIKLGRIEIIKHTEDADWNEILEAGAEFVIYLKSAGSYEAADENERDHLICDENGFAQSRDLPYGVYTVQQVFGWEGRKLAEDFEVVIAGDGEVHSFELLNRLYRGSIHGLKKDNSGNGLGGAVIGLFHADQPDTPVQTTTSANDGSFTFDDIPYGEWIIREIEAPSGYILSEEIYPVTISEDGTVVEVEIVNTLILGNVQLTKVDADYPENKLTGAEFQIYRDTNGNRELDDEDEAVGILPEIEPGIYRMDSLPYGGYFVQETKAPEGFYLDENAYHFEITQQGETVEVENEAGKGFINNAQVGSLKIIKTSSDGHVEGFSFRVTGPNGYDKTFITNEKGEIIIEGLRIGAYTVSEVLNEASQDYVLPADKTCTIIDRVTTEVEMHNEPRDTPKTGDDSNPTLWFMLMGVSAIGLAACGFYTIRKRKK